MESEPVEPIETEEPIESGGSILKPRKKKVQVNLSEEERQRRRDNMNKIRAKRFENDAIRTEQKAKMEAEKLALREERQRIKIKEAEEKLKAVAEKKTEKLKKLKSAKPVAEQEEPMTLKKGTYVDLSTDEKVLAEYKKTKAQPKKKQNIKIINKMDSDDEGDTDNEISDEKIVIVNRLPKKKAEKKLPSAEPKKPEMICKFV